MPFTTAPDIQYVMDSSFELLEQTPDVNTASYFSGMNLVQYFDMYDAHYSREGACSSIKNLCSVMHDWIDKQDELTRAVVLATNIYDVNIQLNELIMGATNVLVRNYLNNNGIQEDLGMFNWMNPNDERNIVNVTHESDILFPANIATAIIQDNRSFEYVTMLKRQLVKSFETDVKLEHLQNKYKKLVNSASKSQSLYLSEEIVFTQTEARAVKSKEDLQEKARKAIKKGVKKFSNLFGRDDIKSFINGSGFVAEGKKYNWRFKQKESISLLAMTHSPMTGHIPYSLQLLTKSGIVIADCCVAVSNKTPIIDQVITIMLYIQHDEEALIKNCNLFNVKDIGEVDNNFNNYKFASTSLQGERTGQAAFQSTVYLEQFSRLTNIYRPQVKEVFGNVIGIDKQFFDFMLSDVRNPIIDGNSSNFYLTNFDSNLLIKI